MLNKPYQGFIVPLFILLIFAIALRAAALEFQEVQKGKTQDNAKESCFTSEARTRRAERESLAGARS